MRNMVRSACICLALLCAAPSVGAPKVELSERAYERLVDLVSRMYLHPDQVRASGFLRGAANQLANDIPWLLVEEEGDAVYLRHGSGVPIGSVSAAQVSTLPVALVALESLLMESGYDLEDVDVRTAVLKGMTQPLDRYSKVLAGDQLSRFDVRLKGTLVGVGATMSLRGDQIVVTQLLPGAPAEKGGLKVKDVLQRIDGFSTMNMPISEVTRRIRGQLATEVELSVSRNARELDLLLIRDRVVVPNVSHRVLKGDIGYIKIDHFSQKTSENLRKSIQGLRASGAVDNGIVLDLRQNTGGSMKEAARAADQFVSEGMLLRTAGADGGRVQNLQAQMDAVKDGQEVTAPIIILVDDRTASGSEILAGALLQLGRAALVGQTTYGKGTVQKIYTLSPTARLKLTVAEYILAGDLRISLGGLRPDVALADVVLGDGGVRYRGWSEDEAGQRWEDILPVVTERSSWRDQVHKPGDLHLELARRALLHAPNGDREGVLKSLARRVEVMRAAQEAHLLDAFAAHQIDWSTNPTPVLEGVVPDVDLSLIAQAVEGQKNEYVVRVEVENLGKETLHQSMVQVDCPTFNAWDDLVIPLGKIPPGERAVGEIRVSLRPGLPDRQDEVTAFLRTDGYPVLPVGTSAFVSKTTPLPDLRVETRLVGFGKDRRAEVMLHNESSETLRGVEVYFSHPGELDMELLERAARVPSLAPGKMGQFSLGVRVGESVPDNIPLNLVIDANGYRDPLAKWPLLLPVDGKRFEVQPPRIDLHALPIVASVGPFELPVRVTDEQSVEYAVVYLNGQKVAWLPGGEGGVDQAVPMELLPGRNRIMIVTKDDEGLRTKRSVRIWGEEPVSVDAASPQTP